MHAWNCASLHRDWSRSLSLIPFMKFYRLPMVLKNKIFIQITGCKLKLTVNWYSGVRENLEI